VAVDIDLNALLAVITSILLTTDWSVLEVHSVSRRANIGSITYKRIAWSVTGLGLLMCSFVWFNVMHTNSRIDTYVCISPWWRFIIPSVVLMCLYSRKISMEHDLSLALLVCRCTGHAMIAEDYVQLFPNTLVGLMRWALFIVAQVDAAFAGYPVCLYEKYSLALLISAHQRNRLISYDHIRRTLGKSAPR
jgi:hypothetical protein